MVMSFAKICKTGNVDFIEYICAKFPETITQVTQDIFVGAIEKRKYDFVEKLVASGIDVNNKDPFMKSPLEAAWNDDRLLKILLCRRDIKLVAYNTLLYLNVLRMLVRRPELLELALQTEHTIHNKKELCGAFLEACSLGILESVELIIQHPMIYKNDIASVLAKIKKTRNPDKRVVELLEARV